MIEQNQQTASADLKSIGNALKAKREEKAFTLEHIAEITRITLSNLRNIENGDMDSMPGLVFVRGFVRNYANLLGIESDWMIETLNQAYNEDDARIATVEDIKNKEDEPLKNKARLSYIFSAVAFVIVVSVLLYGKMSNDENESENYKLSNTIEAVEPELKEGQVADNNQNTGANNDASQQKIVNSIISPLNLVLIGNKAEWIRLSIDNKDPQELILKENERYEWPAEKLYSLTMTTGSTAKIHLNGEEIEINENLKDKLFEIRLNKFSLTRLNN